MMYNKFCNLKMMNTNTLTPSNEQDIHKYIKDLPYKIP